MLSQLLLQGGNPLVRIMMPTRVLILSCKADSFSKLCGREQGIFCSKVCISILMHFDVVWWVYQAGPWLGRAK